ncbi:arginine--tRNA ligase [candidate division WWE3 bacterium CG08_land_8_20_14_0_20_41_15]|uniref:Arginine--tRNA ligase n=1 Tax=candidate division WWE3 bacterium CG08_land_8_20_14_0_20_41_15 TaxID=1975086 RepID=A0A2H0X8T2_UNCKA|nr:MAG: arginine--tRNA ligase [candidate division WWE3 bacterium CG08_land_8_20_14_0_20_41_15]
MIIEELEKVLKDAIVSKYPKMKVAVAVEASDGPSHGNFTSSVSFSLAKIANQSPFEIAKFLAESINNSISKGGLPSLSKVEAVMPGFLNFFLSADFYLSELNLVLKEKEKFGSSKIGAGKRVVIDYSAPNIAKPFGIGHLRSTVIGQSLYNIYKFSGFSVVGDNHLGDWGTQFGKLIYAIKTWGDAQEIAKNPISELTRLYVLFHEEAQKNPSLEDEGRAWFKKLEDGDKEALTLLKQCTDWSMKEYDRVYDLLGVKIDYAYGESFYQDKMGEIVELAKKKGLAKESEGALVVFFDEGEKMSPLILQKSDEASTYATRDLATIKFREKEFGPLERIIYEVGSDQLLHFRQLFLVAKLLGLAKGTELIHVAHGMMRFKDGKMSTRSGKTILLDEVLSGAVERARKIVESKSPDISTREKEEIAKTVGIGAIKYNDLAQDPKTEVLFDWGKVLNLEGNSGPYLQYTYARAKSVLRKSNGYLVLGTGKNKLKDISLSPDEHNILRHVVKYPMVVTSAAECYSPNLIANYLFELASLFNAFYNNVSISKSEGETRDFRLALTEAVSIILKSGLGLLGIEVLERM